MSPLSVLTPVLLGALLAAAGPTQFFREEFGDGDAWTRRWVESKHKPDYGRFVLTAGKFYGDAEKDKGIQTSQDARFYALSSRFEPFSNRDKTLVVQFTVKHEQNIDCGGGYVKLFPASLSQEDMHGDSEYNIMFGPDICGPGTKKVHVIFNYKGKNVLINKDIRCKDDEFTHLYTLVLRPDNTYEVKIDNARVESGSLEEDWDFLPPKKIKDPEAKKPDDWDERAKIDDPEDTKPEDWDKPEHIPDPDAKKPEDWDEEMDGEWEPPVIQNPEYKGEWRPQQIDNPDYKGKWVHPEIDNPEYSPDPLLYSYDSFGVIGLDLWQVKSGTIFDNFLITDDEKLAEEIGNETWGATKVRLGDTWGAPGGEQDLGDTKVRRDEPPAPVTSPRPMQDAERKMKEQQDEEQRKKQEEEEKQQKEEEGDDDSDGDEEEEDEEESEAEPEEAEAAPRDEL
ncbi:calreticulin isoform X1 [Agelaius tricolor]